MRRYEITDQQWQLIAHLLPGKEGDVGVTAADNRLFINAILWIGRSGAPWRDLPERFGLWNSVYQRFRRWAKEGVWQAVFQALQDPDLEWLMIDSTVVRAHQHASGQKKTIRPANAQANRWAGGPGRRSDTKIHAAVDAPGNPLRIILTVGQRADCTQAESLVADYEPGAVLADRGYDTDAFVDLLDGRQIEVVIPAKKNRLQQRAIDKNRYKDRNKVERFFNKLNRTAEAAVSSRGHSL